MKYFRFILFITAILSLSGCDQLQTALNSAPATESEAVVVSGDVIATVNGTSITQEILDVYNKQRAAKGAKADPNNPGAALEELIALELMKQEALNEGVGSDPAVIATINQLERSTLAGAGIKSFMSNNEVSEEAVKAEYDVKMGTPGKEYNARHILVEEEDQAKEVIKMLDGGADFAELAKEKSTGPSGPNGGTLGWFGAGQMVKPFSDATAALEKGSYTKEPVKTQFGWHVILLEETRDSTPPPFDDIKDRLKMVMTNQKLQEHIKAIRETATIDIK